MTDVQFVGALLLIFSALGAIFWTYRCWVLNKPMPVYRIIWQEKKENN